MLNELTFKTKSMNISKFNIGHAEVDEIVINFKFVLNLRLMKQPISVLLFFDINQKIKVCRINRKVVNLFY